MVAIADNGMFAQNIRDLLGMAPLVSSSIKRMEASSEEEAIAELIADFESKIDTFFDFIKSDDMGKRLIAKIKDDGSAFSPDEIYTDFNKLYRKYTIMNKDLGEFFKKETKDILNQLCDDFERIL